MDNNTILIIGGTVLIVGGIAAAGIMGHGMKQSADGLRSDDDMAIKMEQQDFEDYLDEERYSFCQGREEIKGVYTNSILGSEKGNITYISDDISVFDKEKNKLFILGRRITYTYYGDAQLAFADGEGVLNISEEGVTTEYFSKYTAPARIDYNANMIIPAPERKSTDWVAVRIKSIGTLMGITDEREDIENGDAKVFCPSFTLEGISQFPDYISFEKVCPDYSPNPGVAFSGNFSYACGGVENARGVELAKEYQTLEQLQYEFNNISGDNDNQQGDEFEHTIQQSQSDNQDTHKKLQELRDELKSNIF